MALKPWRGPSTHASSSALKTVCERRQFWQFNSKCETSQGQTGGRDAAASCHFRSNICDFPESPKTIPIQTYNISFYGGGLSSRGPRITPTIAGFRRCAVGCSVLYPSRNSKIGFCILYISCAGTRHKVHKTELGILGRRSLVANIQA